jgi:hypothetical protein
MKFDPRDYDSRDDERHANPPSRGIRGDSGDCDRDDDWSQHGTWTCDRGEDDARSLGWSPGTIAKPLIRQDPPALPGWQ